MFFIQLQQKSIYLGPYFLLTYGAYLSVSFLLPHGSSLAGGRTMTSVGHADALRGEGGDSRGADALGPARVRPGTTRAAARATPGGAGAGWISVQAGRG